ncbi:MAG: PA14 domain-containing protein [Planctomycetota bacterium]|jgi:hypothetical protein
MMSKELICLMSLVLVFSLTATAPADQVAIEINNAGFEDPVLAADGWTWLEVPGWTWIGGEGPGVWNVTSADFEPVLAPEGQNVLYTETDVVGNTSGVGQILTETFAADTSYTLTVEIGNSNYYYFSGYSVQLLAGGVVIAEDDDTLWPEYYKWATSTIEYTYDPAHADLVGEPLEIRLLHLALDKDNPPAGGVLGVEFDDVRLSYDDPAAGFRASDPAPADGAMLAETWVQLSWSPAESAVSHNIYMADNFDDVNDRTAAALVASQPLPALVVGFFEMPFPGGLVAGTTYYWAVDEVDADGETKHKGLVWSFWIQPRTAYDPSPADGMHYVDPDVELSWMAGLGSKLHYVHFGDNFDDVNNAAPVAGELSPVTSFTPGPLESGKTYYWRVDESDPPNPTIRGAVWSFTITQPGGGLTAEYFNNTLLSGEPAVTRVDPEIDFDWGTADVPGENSPDASINVNNFGARWTGELKVDLTDKYIFGINANNGFRLWLDGEPIIKHWNNSTTGKVQSSPIELVGGESYSIRMEYFEGEGTAIAQLFWESSTREEQIIPSGALQPLSRAGDPSPYNGATGVTQMIIPTWRASETAASHQVYFGTDAEAVSNATTASPEYKGSRALGSETIDPGKLAWQTTYYWRVDEVDSTNNAAAGKVWSFTTGDFLVVEDFESYNDLNPGDPGSNRIFTAWTDGYGTTTNGALVGNDAAPFMELGFVHGGLQSLPYFYDNANKTSEATLTLTYPRNWTEESVTKLSIWFRGSTANAADRMFVVLNGTAVVYHDDPAATQKTGWNEWVIDLSEFAGVDLTNVNTMTIGVGTKNAPAAGGTGTLYFDDIRLYR